MNTIIMAVITAPRTACHVLSSSGHDFSFTLQYFIIQTYSLCCNPTGFLPLVLTDSNPEPLTDKIFYFYSVGPCHYGMARTQVAVGGTAPDMEGSCE
jgi:hypothetical protein